MSMSKPKRRAPAAPATNPKLDKEEREEKTMNDLPPEVLTIILEHVIVNQWRKDMLVYRLVSSQWKDIVDSLLEKEVISRRLDVFPAMKIGGQPDQLSVYCPRTVFRAGGNPLSFNSLLLIGYKNFPHGPADTQMALPIFISKFGGNLTTFSLQDQMIGPKSLAALLRSMSNLKVICFENVELTSRSIGPGGILQPPSLLSLTTLELKSVSYYGKKDDKRNALYVWLIASYADQLVVLNLKVFGNPLPALQKCYEYSIPWRRGESVSVATTSDSAFGKLKELKVCSPSSQFLRFTQTPAVQHLSIPSASRVELRDLKKLIGTCGSSLREVSLELDWYALVNREVVQNLLTAGMMARNVKKLTVRFSVNENETLIDRALLTMFPGLERIQLLFYNSLRLYWEIARCQGGNQVAPEMNEGDRAVEINALKRRLLALRERIAVLQRRQRDFAEIEVRPQIYEAIITVRNERASIFKRLAALGENVNKVVVEQMLEQQGVWNTCPDLKTVSVSSREKPVGDICVIQRMDDARDFDRECDISLSKSCCNYLFVSFYSNSCSAQK